MGIDTQGGTRQASGQVFAGGSWGVGGELGRGRGVGEGEFRNRGWLDGGWWMARRGGQAGQEKPAQLDTNYLKT